MCGILHGVSGDDGAIVSLKIGGLVVALEHDANGELVNILKTRVGGVALNFEEANVVFAVARGR